MSDLNSTLDKYDKEFELDVMYDMTTLSTATFKHPNIYHKWVVKLRQHEKNIIDINRKLDDYVVALSKKEKEALPNLSEAKLKTKITSSEGYKKAKRILEDEQLAVEHLKRLVRILDQMGFNFKVSTEHFKLELEPR